METGGGSSCLFAPSFTGRRSVANALRAGPGCQKYLGGVYGGMGVVQGVGHRRFYTQQLSAVELRLAGVPVGQGGGAAWLPPALWGQLGVSLSFGTPWASGAGWRALVPLFCLWGKRGGMACSEVWGGLVLKRQLPGRGNVQGRTGVGHGDGTAPGDGVRNQPGSLERGERLCSTGGAPGWSWGNLGASVGIRGGQGGGCLDRGLTALPSSGT